MAVLGARFDAAFQWTREIHAEQRRHNTGAPYISHLMQTAALVMEDGLDEDAVIAALMHDAIEDQGIPLTQISERLGPRVAALVSDCTDSFGARAGDNWRARKRRHVARMATMPVDSLRVIAADKAASLQALVDDLAVFGWDLFADSTRSAEELFWNYDQILAVLRSRQVPGAPVARLGRLVEEFRGPHECPWHT